TLPKRTETLQLRYATPEDRFRPYGMKKGQKKVFTYLKEQGLPPMYRGCVPVLTFQGQIVAVMPFQIDDRFALTSGSGDTYILSFGPTSSSFSGLLELLKR
ncbi:tRNA lysidine(34) synthetase TilS C-terminal domain-containing protein, partial [Porphyromonas cangingivalis]|uniref:tRNA lysidine(34) synthetase TilS C-terminal domain-containing protein n=1 Tax=Porphyromonas cangingivalis TaxID=36874 RepID=UPI00242BF83E